MLRIYLDQVFLFFVQKRNRPGSLTYGPALKQQMATDSDRLVSYDYWYLIWDFLSLVVGHNSLVALYNVVDFLRGTLGQMEVMHVWKHSFVEVVPRHHVYMHNSFHDCLN